MLHTSRQPSKALHNSHRFIPAYASIYPGFVSFSLSIVGSFILVHVKPAISHSSRDGRSRVKSQQNIFHFVGWRNFHQVHLRVRVKKPVNLGDGSAREHVLIRFPSKKSKGHVDMVDARSISLITYLDFANLVNLPSADYLPWHPPSAAYTSLV